MWANMWFTLSAHNKGQVFEKGKQTRNMWDSSRFDLTLLLLFFFKDVSIKKKKSSEWNLLFYENISAPETFRHTSHLGSKADPLPAEGSHASLWLVQTRRRVLAFDVTSFSFWRTSKLDFTGDLNKQKQPQNFLKDPWRQLSSSWSAAP